MYKIIILLLLAGTLHGQDYDTAMGLYQEKKYAEALTAAESIPEKGFEVVYLEAHIRMVLEKFVSATKKMNEAISLRPAEAGPRVDMVRLLMRRGRNIDALAFAEKSVRELPDSVDVRLAHAYALLRNKKPKTALGVVEKLKAARNDDYRPLLVEGTIYYTLRDYEKAEVSFTWAAALDENNQAVNNNLAIVYDKLAGIARDKRDAGKQREYLEKAKACLEKANEQGHHWAVERNLKRIDMLLGPGA